MAAPEMSDLVANHVPKQSIRPVQQAMTHGNDEVGVLPGDVRIRTFKRGSVELDQARSRQLVHRGERSNVRMGFVIERDFNSTVQQQHDPGTHERRGKRNGCGKAGDTNGRPSGAIEMLEEGKPKGEQTTFDEQPSEGRHRKPSWGHRRYVKAGFVDKLVPGISNDSRDRDGAHHRNHGPPPTNLGPVHEPPRSKNRYRLAHCPQDRRSLDRVVVPPGLPTLLLSEPPARWNRNRPPDRRLAHCPRSRSTA